MKGLGGFLKTEAGESMRTQEGEVVGQGVFLRGGTGREKPAMNFIRTHYIHYEIQTMGKKYS